MMISETFPPNSLTLSRLLKTLEAAKSDKAIQEAFIRAVRFVQDARRLPEKSFTKLLEDGCEAHPATLPSVVDFAIDFHECSNGDRLGFWLYPIVIKHTGKLAESLPMQQHMEAIQRIAAEFASTAFPRDGSSDITARPWCLPVARLVFSDLIASMPVTRLLSVSVDARTSLREGRPAARFVTPKPGDLSAGEHLYFLPLIVRHPQESLAKAPAPCAEISSKLLSLVSNLKDREGQSVQACVVEEGPLTFSQGMHLGAILGLRDGISQAISQVTASCPYLQPAGMQAQVCIYHAGLPSKDDLNEQQVKALEMAMATPGYYLGVTAASRLDGSPVMTFVTQLDRPDDAAKTVRVVCDALRDAGIGRIAAIDQPLDTVWCPDCRQIHMMAPQVEAFAVAPVSIN